MNNDRKTRTVNRLLTVLPVAALAFSLTACAGAAERPSSDELVEGISTIFEDQGVDTSAFPDEVLTCLADAMVDSEISDQDLANIAEGKDEQTSQEAYDLVQSTMMDATKDCAGGAGE